MAEVTQLFIVREKRGAVSEITEASLEAGKGIVGDRYHAASSDLIARGESVPENHISFIASEELEAFLSENNSDLGFGDFRRSIVTKGIDLNSLVGKTFRVGDAVCYGNEPCEPCAYLAATVHRGVLPGLNDKAGLRATIIESGTISKGSKIEEV